MTSRVTTVLLSCLFLASCSGEKKKSEDLPEASSKTEVILSDEQVKSAAIETGKVVFREISGSLKVNGILDVPPQNLVSISAPLGGFVKNTELLQGMKVKKGQVLVTLEGPDYIQLQEDFLNSKSQLEYLDQEYTRQQDLAKENVNAAKTLQMAKSNYLGMKAKTEGLAAKLRLVHLDPAALEKGSIQNTISIASPITGFISQVNINIGMHVGPTDVMFRVVDTEHLHAEAQVYDKDISLLKLGQKVRVYLTNDPRERLASVYLIGKEVTADRTVRVHCHFEEEDPSLIPGLYFNGYIEVSGHSVAALPNEAIVTYEGKKFVFAASDRTHFQMKELKTGAAESGFTEVIMTDSLAASDIVIRGAYELLAQLKNSEE